MPFSDNDLQHWALLANTGINVYYSLQDLKTAAATTANAMTTIPTNPSIISQLDSEFSSSSPSSSFSPKSSPSSSSSGFGVGCCASILSFPSNYCKDSNTPCVDHIPYYNILWAEEAYLDEAQAQAGNSDGDTNGNNFNTDPSLSYSKPIKVSFMQSKNPSSSSNGKLAPKTIILTIVTNFGSSFLTVSELSKRNGSINKFNNKANGRNKNGIVQEVEEIIDGEPFSEVSSNEENAPLLSQPSKLASGSTKKKNANKKSTSKDNEFNNSNINDGLFISNAPSATNDPVTPHSLQNPNTALTETIPNPTSSSSSSSQFTSHCIQTLLQYSYACTQTSRISTQRTTKLRKRFLVIINPHGGPGKAKQIYEKECAPVLKLANCKTTVVETTHQFHAIEIARDYEFLVRKGNKHDDTAGVENHGSNNGDNDGDEFELVYDAIICCSGDGIPHEIINGLISRAQGDGYEILKRVPLAQLPCGSGNSMAVSLNGPPASESSSCSPAAVSLGFVKGLKMEVDLMLMTQADDGEYENGTGNGENTGSDNDSHVKKSLCFLTQTFGIVADADLGTEHLRWMGGARFDVGIFKSLLFMKSYPCDIYVKYAHETKAQVKQHFICNNNNDHEAGNSTHTNGGNANTSIKVPNDGIDVSQYTTLTQPKSTAEVLTPHYGTVNDPVPSNWSYIDGSNLCMFYAGKMPWVSSDALMFPAILPTDCTMDLLITATNTMSRVQAAQMMMSIEQGKHVEFDQVQYSKVSAYRLVPKNKNKNGQQEQGYLSIDGESFPYTPFQVEVVPRAGCLLSPTGGYYQTGFGNQD